MVEDVDIGGPGVELAEDSPEETVNIETFDGFGELTIGVGSNWGIIITAICMLDNPTVNKFLLAQKLKLSDRITKSKIFPREGMTLPNGEVYKMPAPSVVEKEEEK